MDPAWFALGAALGVLLVWGLHTAGVVSRDSAITSGAALLLAGIAALVTPRRRARREDAPIAADVGEELAAPAREAAHDVRQEAREEAEAEVDAALAGPTPEEELAAIGNQRRGAQ